MSGAIEPPGLPSLDPRYESLAVVGSSAAGHAVVKAWDRQHGRPVALKIRRVSTPAERTSVLAEAGAVLDLPPHPGLPMVRDDFFVEDHHVLVMDWIEGTDLGQLLASQGDPGLPRSAVLGWLTQAAAALDHLHARRPPVVHGDIKPANLLLTDDGRVVVVDVAAEEPDASARRRGDVTAGFVAPEVLAGHPPASASDIYAFAATAFALLTGHPPGAGRPPADPPDAPDAATARTAERAVRLALDADPSRRPATAGAVIERLRAWTEPELPSGVVTFLLTDVEGSTAAWDRAPESMAGALARHEDLVADAVGHHQGMLVKTRGEGDATFSVFSRASDAAAGALELQQAMASEPWPAGVTVNLRVALHTGEAELRGGDYFGTTINRAARLRSLARGGQTLLSQATAELVADTLPSSARLIDVGVRALRDLARPEQVYELRNTAEHSSVPGQARANGMDAGPITRTTFIGRHGEIEMTAKLLDRWPMVTVTGPGGVGKTRLAIEAGGQLKRIFPDGVTLVELAVVADPDLVAEVVARTLGVKEQAGVAVADAVATHLADRRLLLILDNCEHQLEAAAQLAETVIATCADVRILATSRAPLGVKSERTLRLAPLPYPSRDDLSVIELAQVEAVRLFVDRAEVARNHFALTAANAPAVAAICRRLDGIPLAIELAAARVKVLSPQQIADRLADRFALLKRDSRTDLPRHQTLRALIDWSYALLSPTEQTLLNRLSVFVGGCTVEQAEEVCADVADGADVAGGAVGRDDVIDLLLALVDHSLLQREERGEEFRFDMLESIRQYAEEKLVERGETARMAARHQEWFLRLAETTSQPLRGDAEVERLDRLEAEHDNLRAALTWCQSQPDRVYEQMRLAVGLHSFWLIRGYVREGGVWLDAALGRSAEPTIARARALSARGELELNQGGYDESQRLLTLARDIFATLGDEAGAAGCDRLFAVTALRQGRYDEARTRFEAIVDAGRASGDRGGVANALLSLGALAESHDELALAHDRYREALELFRQVDDTGRIGVALNGLGNAAFRSGDLGSARRHYEESLALRQRLGDKRGMAASLSGLGNVALAERTFDDARALHAKAVELTAATGDTHNVAIALINLADVACAAEEWERGVRLLAASESILTAMGVPIVPADRAQWDRDLAGARQALTEARYADAQAWGRGATVTEAVRYALE